MMSEILSRLLRLELLQPPHENGKLPERVEP